MAETWEQRVEVAQRLLGQRIREARMQAGLQMPDAADAMGMSVSYLSDCERGRKLPSLQTLMAIADGLGFTVRDLLEGLYPFDDVSRPRRLPDPPEDGRRTRYTY